MERPGKKSRFIRTMGSFMKKCPFCAESIQDEAIKCRFCGERVPVVKTITADHVETQSNLINEMLATKSPQDLNKAKLVLQELICQIKDASNKDAFVTELKNAEDAYLKIGGSPGLVVSTQEKLALRKAVWGLCGMLILVSGLFYAFIIHFAYGEAPLPILMVFLLILFFCLVVCIRQLYLIFIMAGYNTKTAGGVGVPNSSSSDQTS